MWFFVLHVRTNVYFEWGDETLETSKEGLFQAAMEGVRRYGLDGVSMRQIASLAGASPSNAYTYFSSKDELMRACFERVDRQIAHIFDRIRFDEERLATAPEEEIRHQWTAYYRWLVAHPNETVFYHRFRDSPGFWEFERKRDVSYFSSFTRFTHAFEERYRLQEKTDFHILWLHVLTSTVMYAKYVVEGVLPSTNATEENIFQLMMSGIQGLLCQSPAESAN